MFFACSLVVFCSSLVVLRGQFLTCKMHYRWFTQVEYELRTWLQQVHPPRQREREGEPCGKPNPRCTVPNLRFQRVCPHQACQACAIKNHMSSYIIILLVSLMSSRRKRLSCVERWFQIWIQCSFLTYSMILRPRFGWWFHMIPIGA